MAVLFLFVVLFLSCGKIGMYGLAVFSNLTFLFSGIGGVMLLCGKVTWTHFWKDKQVVFTPHILIGYIAVIIALLI